MIYQFPLMRNVTIITWVSKNSRTTLANTSGRKVLTVWPCTKEPQAKPVQKSSPMVCHWSQNVHQYLYFGLRN